MIGEVGVDPDDYWKLTKGETIGLITGYQLKQSYESANFRNIFDAMVKLWSKESKSIQQMWPLPIDNEDSDMTADEMFERNRKAIDYFNSIRKN